MQTIKITVTGNQAVAVAECPLVGGTVGLPVEFSFDAEWENLEKTAVFRVGKTVMDCLDVYNVAVPWELMKKVGSTLYIGVYGVNADSSVQIPTVWAKVGQIQPGAEPSEITGGQPHIPVWQQVFEKVDSSVEQALIQAKRKGEFDGKSAYDYAVEEGYTGTQEEFAQKLAAPVTPVLYLEFSLVSVHYDGQGGGNGVLSFQGTYSQIYQAISDGRVVIGLLQGAPLSVTAWNNYIVFSGYWNGYHANAMVMPGSTGSAGLNMSKGAMQLSQKATLVQDVIAALPVYDGEVEAV